MTDDRTFKPQDWIVNLSVTFCYLGSYISDNAVMKKIWSNNEISLKVKLRLCESIILLTLLYNGELWQLS